MRFLRVAVLVLLGCIACRDPLTAPAAESEPPWYAGQWQLLDSIVVDYALANFNGSGVTVTINVTDTRTGTVHLTPVPPDSVAVLTQGAARRVVRSSIEAPSVWDQTLDFTVTLHAPPGYLVGMYMSEPDDSLPLPVSPATSIYWLADTMAVCRSWRRSLEDPLNNLVPGSVGCRHRMRWQRP